MSKVGILSMQRIKNYGSFLQAYALKSIIEELGHEVEFVDYRIEKPLIVNNSKAKQNTLQKGIEVLKGNAKISHKIKYILYKKNFGKRYYKLLNISEAPNYTPKLDTLVIGSDEVFNCIQSNENVGYSLELFGKNNNANKVITYAASFGNTTLDKIRKFKKADELSNLLAKISSISVRDNNSAEIIKNLTLKEVSFHLDPVLIYDFENKCKNIPEIKVKEKYMVLYAYSNRISNDEAKIIKRYCKEKNIKIYSIGGAQPYADKFIDCSPFELLSYFKNAEFVITDTFHGTIFSIINKKNFVTLVRKSIGNEYGNEEKLVDLLNKLNLSNRLVFKMADNIKNQLESNINYKAVFDIIKNERINAYNYLNKNLSDGNKAITINKLNCSGCGACVSACPKNAIELREDEEGFLYPYINKEKCINCGICSQICNYKKNIQSKKIDKAYAVISKNSDILKKSASGGIFAELATNFILDGGVVYGSSLEYENEKLICKHIRVNNINDLEKLQGSKYIQSNFQPVLKDIKKDLENGLKVLVSGTPCQISGLNGFLRNKEYDNLYTIDIICHGVPNNHMFNEYIKFLEKKYQKKIIDYKFRDKSKGWKLNAKIIFENGEECIIPSYKSSFYQLFLDGHIYRKNCYSCPFANLNRKSDLTIGDYWGVNEEHQEEIKSSQIKIENGISCIISNTEKGDTLIYSCRNDLILINSEPQKIAKHNRQLQQPSVKKNIREKIFNNYLKQSYKKVDNYYKNINSLKIIIKSLLRK